MNILNFAVDQERCAIINHLAKVTANRPEVQDKLVKNRFGTNEIQAIHQAVTIGNKVLLECIIRDFRADIDVQTAFGLTPMHCAAQHYGGYLSILLLVKQYQCEVNCTDKIQATPLHFAILKGEFKNIELLIKFGANVNAKDKLGQTPLHISILRIGQDPSQFKEYKNIIKELLFNGADRSLTT